MRSRSSFVLALGFSVLVVLIAVLGIGAIRRARTIYAEMERTQESYLSTEAFRRDIALRACKMRCRPARSRRKTVLQPGDRITCTGVSPALSCSRNTGLLTLHSSHR